MTREWQERFLLLLCAAILAWQLFLPGFIGMANNGDFGKVAGPLNIGGADDSADNFVFFQPEYVRGPKKHFAPGVPTSEIALAWLASTAQETTGDAGRFDIRWLGALHALIFLGAYYTALVILRHLRTAWRLALSLAALWIFADAVTLAYFNSFYMDAAAILGALTAAMLGARLATGEVRPALLVLFGAASLLYVTSKGQHAMVPLAPVLAALAFSVVARGRVRVLAAIVAVAILGGSVWTLARMPDWYGGQSRFDLIFFRIAKNSPAPAADLRELGLGDSELPYVGMHAFMQGTPMADRDFATSFSRRTSYGRIVAFYWRHPGVAMGKLWSDLRDLAPLRRPVNLSNFQRKQGMPAGARTGRLSSWSWLRSKLFEWWPAHIVLWYGIALMIFPLLGMRSGPGFRRSLAWVISAVALAGAMEFAVASLADAVETDRHLLLFHLLTDVTMFLALVWAAGKEQPSADVRPARSHI